MIILFSKPLDKTLLNDVISQLERTRQPVNLKDFHIIPHDLVEQVTREYKRRYNL
jgi:hypothetical protein